MIFPNTREKFFPSWLERKLGSGEGAGIQVHRRRRREKLMGILFTREGREF
jgi:hypothetical protein